jgi:hypothetical protein
MKVRELIAELQKLDYEKDIWMTNVGRYYSEPAIGVIKERNQLTSGDYFIE